MNIAKTALIVALVAVVIAIGGYSFPQTVKDVFGAVGSRFPNGLAVGLSVAEPTRYALSVGSTTPKQIFSIGAGTCNLRTGATGGGGNEVFLASSTKMHFCDATGVRIGDIVWVTLRSSQISASSSILAGPNLYGSFVVAGAVATTSDIIGVALTNWTGVSSTSYVQATTGVQYLIFR